MKKGVKVFASILIVFAVGYLCFIMIYLNNLKPKNAKKINTGFGELFYPKELVTEDSI